MPNTRSPITYIQGTAKVERRHRGLRHGSGDRPTENIALGNLTEDEMTEGKLTESKPKTRIPLCEKYELPEGIQCPSRNEKSGIFWCNGKENCPLEKKG